MGAIAGIITGETIPVQSMFYYVVSVIVIFLLTVMAFGGIRRIVSVSNKMVPVMAMIYVLTIVTLIAANTDSIPYFFHAVFVGAFSPEAVEALARTDARLITLIDLDQVAESNTNRQIQHSVRCLISSSSKKL